MTEGMTDGVTDGMAGPGGRGEGAALDGGHAQVPRV